MSTRENIRLIARAPFYDCRLVNYFHRMIDPRRLIVTKNVQALVDYEIMTKHSPIVIAH